jgi:large subunit ribosomal protein L15
MYPSHALPAAEVYQHPSLQNLENISLYTKIAATHKSRLSALAHRYGLDEVVRWKPMNEQDLKASGKDAVMAEAVYAIVGAVAMERGGTMAIEVARERVLAQMGLR